MIFDFFRPFSNISIFCKHFSITERTLLEGLSAFNPRNNIIGDFAKNMGLDLLTKTDDCEILCRHITTCADDLKSITNIGLRPLKYMLQENSPLSDFLESYEIRINVDLQEMVIGGDSYLINSEKEPCTPCPHGKAIEKAIRWHYNCCDFHEYMERLNTKLYHDKCEIEAYLSGSDERMLETYQTILQGPEILLTIGDVLHALDNKTDRNKLQYEWANQPGMKRYVLRLQVPLNAIETNSDYKSQREYYDYSEWYEQAGYNEEQYFEKSIPLEFYRNKLLIEQLVKGVVPACSSYDNSYCQIIPSYVVPPERIEVIKMFNISEQ